MYDKIFNDTSALHKVILLFLSLFQNGDVIEGVASKRDGYLTLSVF